MPGKNLKGEPIDYDPNNCGPEDLRDLCRSTVEKMKENDFCLSTLEKRIAEKQRNRSGSIWEAFLLTARFSEISVKERRAQISNLITALIKRSRYWPMSRQIETRVK